jgi:3-oxoacyl-[acyl-carrier-protein] synthase I
MEASNPSLAPIYVSAYTLTSALGAGNQATLDSLRQQRGGLRQHELRAGGTTWIGFIDHLGDEPITGELANFDCQSNRILGRAMQLDRFKAQVERARQRYGADRVGLFLGTITAGLMHLESCYRQHDWAKQDLGPDARVSDTAQLYSATRYCQDMLGISGPAAVISTACSSSGKVFSAAHRYIQADLCDAVVVVGIECACETIVYGFRSLGLLSTSPCRPWDKDRDGLSVGEAAGFALLERDPEGDCGVALLGYGESGDAYHMTTPHPEGAGAVAAMERALAAAGLSAQEIDYINLHGSGTPANDQSEDAAVYRVFGNKVPASSTKGWTGHTQGAAGITEAILSIAAIRHGLIPASLNTRELYPGAQINVPLQNLERPVRRVLSNSFGFGGNNCALIFGAIQ